MRHLADRHLLMLLFPLTPVVRAPVILLGMTGAIALLEWTALMPMARLRPLTVRPMMEEEKTLEILSLLLSGAPLLLVREQPHPTTDRVAQVRPSAVQCTKNIFV